MRNAREVNPGVYGPLPVRPGLALLAKDVPVEKPENIESFGWVWDALLSIGSPEYIAPLHVKKSIHRKYDGQKDLDWTLPPELKRADVRVNGFRMEGGRFKEDRLPYFFEQVARQADRLQHYRPLSGRLIGKCPSHHLRSLHEEACDEIVPEKNAERPFSLMTLPLVSAVSSLV